jgi:hypothetical protein
MSNAESIMKPRRRIAALLALLPWLHRTAVAGLPPVPPCSFPFDVSKRGNSLEEEFRVLAYRNFAFVLQFDYSSGSDLWRVLKLVGDGATYPDGRYAKPGISVSIRLKIYRTSSEKNPEPIFERTVRTEGAYGHGFGRGEDGNYRRMITSVGLQPGLYRVQVTSTEDAPEFVGTPSHLNIEYHSKALPPRIK